MAAAPVWDFPPRSVTFTVSLSATFHPSIGGLSVAVPWLDATGELGAPVALGPLSACEADPSRPARRCQPGVVSVKAERVLGTFPVTLGLVQVIRRTCLPVSVELAGASGAPIPSAASINLAPLLMAGGELPGEGGGAARRAIPSEVFATRIESIGVAGLQRLEVRVSTDIPILSQAMLERLIPVCFTVDAVRGLPNETWLHEKCEEVYVEVAPQLSRATACLADSLPRARSGGRPHDVTARFSEPVVYLLGLAPLHVVREWIQHDGLVVEVHDRDLRAAPLGAEATAAADALPVPVPAAATAPAGQPGKAPAAAAAAPPPPDSQQSTPVAAAKAGKPTCAELMSTLDRLGHDGRRQPHPHGVAKFPLGALLQTRSLQVSLRADVLPARSDKKQRRAEGLKQGLRAEGLLEEEGARKIAERAGIDKREDTTEYQESGTMCTLHAVLAVPIPKASAICVQDEATCRERWANSEAKCAEDGSIWVAKTPQATPTQEAAKPGQKPPPPAAKAAPKAAAAAGQRAAPAAEEAPPAEEVPPRPPPLAAQKLPYRAKVSLPDGTQAPAPWRRTKDEAEADERHLMEVLHCEEERGLPPGEVAAAVRAEAEAMGQTTSTGLDCRYERYGRLVLVVDETQYDVISAVLSKVSALNAQLKKMDPGSAEVDNYVLTEEEKADPHLDLISGFAVLDGRARIFVLEGLRDGSLKELAKVVSGRPNTPQFKLLHNPSIGFSQRLYADFGGLKVKQIKIRQPLEKLAVKSDLYSVSGVASEDTMAGAEAIKLLMELKQMQRMRALRQGAAFPKVVHLQNLQILYGGYMTEAELEGRPVTAESAKKKIRRDVKERALQDAPRESLTNEAAQTLKLDPKKVPRKPGLDMENADYSQTLELRQSASMPDFTRTNRDLIRQQSEANAKINDLMGKKRSRETPFLDGQQVYLYSGQKLNCAELQKEWMRKHMETEVKTKVWTYNPLYNSNVFEFAGGQEPGVTTHMARCPSDTYARAAGDERPVWRYPPARPKEEFRKPPRDVDPARSDLLHEPFVENEWKTLAIGEERRKPLSVKVEWVKDRVPHLRRTTEQPFDGTRVGPGLKEFGPRSGFESVHSAGRPPGEDRYAEAIQHNIVEREKEEKKILFGKHMKTFSQVATRTGINDVDRCEHIMKDPPAFKMRGKVDDPMPVTIRTLEEYHELGMPAKEWHARLRENDQSPPFDVTTGAYLKRDPEVGTKRSCMSGTLGKAPWQHGAELSAGTRMHYPVDHDFNSTRPPPTSKASESQLVKNASRTAISQDERGKLPYRRPIDYGVRLPC